MKIDTDLRMAINAAARAQKEPTYEEQQKAKTAAINALIKLHPGAVYKARKLEAKSRKLYAEATKFEKEAQTALDPLGIEFARREGIEFDLRYGDKATAAFVNAGGKLPPPSKRKWKADDVIKRLVAADPKDRDAILKEYGINWV